jgi:glycosyltransferase involved in cell wall biosynthesis
MKILCVTPFYKPAFIYGGPARSIPALCEGLVQCGCDVSVYTTNANGTEKLDIAAGKPCDLDGVRVTYFDSSGIQGYFYSRDLAAACHGSLCTYDLISVTGSWAYPLIPICRGSLKHSIPYIVSPRTSFMHRTWKYGGLKKLIYHFVFERRLVNRATAIHYTSELELKESAWLRLRPRTFIVPNAVDFDEFDSVPERGLFRSKWRIPSDENIILYLGRLEPRKGLELTLRSFALARDRGLKRATLILAGPDKGHYERVLKDYAFRLGLGDNVIFPGYLNKEERLTALADADAFILLSYGENFGMALVEAMAMGIAPIVSDQVGIAKELSNSKAGSVVPLDPDAIAGELFSFMSSPGARQSCGERARSFVRATYGSRKVARLMVAQYEGFRKNTEIAGKSRSVGICDTSS